jgi:hypothetical protein
VHRTGIVHVPNRDGSADPVKAFVASGGLLAYVTAAVIAPSSRPRTWILSNKAAGVVS